MPFPPKLRPTNDSRYTLRSAHLNGHTYGYIHSPADTSVSKRGTIFLIHGWPDLSFGWRYQIPFLTSLGLEVYALDCMGYGRTDSPPSSNLSVYSFKRISDDIATLCQQQNLTRIILGGHDWGGAVVYRVALYHPTLIQAFFSICTPYQSPSQTYLPMELLFKTALPNLTYQIQLASGQVEPQIQTPQQIRQFLHALYGGRGPLPTREIGFDVEKGILFENLPRIGKSKLISDDEMDYYVQEYSRHGINGPLNWYRTREVNFVDELSFFSSSSPSEKKEIKIRNVEVLFVQATKDAALKPFMAKKMDERIERLTWKHVETGHWALWEKPDLVNEFIGDWLEEKVFGNKGNKDGGGKKESKL